MLWMGQEQPPEPKRLLKDLRSPFRDQGTPSGTTELPLRSPPKDPSTPLRTQGAPQGLGEGILMPSPSPGLKMPS